MNDTTPDSPETAMRKLFEAITTPLPGSSTLRVINFTGFKMVADQIMQEAYEKGQIEGLEHLERELAKTFNQ